MSERAFTIKCFPKLYHLIIKLGCSPEKVYNDLGFPLDQAGNEVYSCQHGIEIEWMQRSKELTYHF
eukprot:11962820-Ditylum_brightwellii.AAC.1